MAKIFGYLAQSPLVLLGMIVLLAIQAYTALTLPQYTADIVNIGIQQGGISQVTPDEMRSTTMDNLTLFLSDEDAEMVKAAYKQDASGNYVLNATDANTITKVGNLLEIPMIMVTQIEQNGLTIPGTNQKLTMDELTAAVQAGQIPKESILAQESTAAQQMKEQMGNLQDMTLTQAGIAFTKAEYEAMGRNMATYQNNYILGVGAKMLGLTLISSVAAIFVGFLSARTAAKAARNLRSRIFNKVVSFSHSEMDRFSTASLITRSTNDIQQIQMVLVMIPRMVFYSPILGIGGVIKVLNTDTSMAWIIAVGVGAVMLVVIFLMIFAMPKFKKMQVLIDRLNLVSREILTGLLVIRAFSREKHEEERFAVANKDLMQNQLFTTRIMMGMMPTMMLIMNGISVLIVWVGAHRIDTGQMQVGNMMAFITYAMMIIMSFLMLSMISIMLPRAIVAANRVEEVLAVEPGITDKATTADNSRPWRGVLAFYDVSFRYPGAEEDALKHVSFEADPGKTTAIIGGTGSGKSTLLHLIPRFYDVTGGEITMDGVDIRDMSQHKLRSLLGYVPQKGVLFSGDIESNIRFAGENVVSEAEMRKAAEIAQATGFIEDKSEQYHSSIAQGGSNVSGGQKQRLSIARAIAAQPKVFLFDDSFSALDYKTDATLRKALNTEIKDATVIIVAQRVGTILHADQILVLDDGKVVGKGTHAELLKTCEAYQEIAKSQLSEKELEGGRS